MSFRLLATMPFACAAAVVIALALVDPGTQPIVTRIGNETGKVLAVAGSLAAALAFERGAYLRRAWLLSGACLVLLLVRDAALLLDGRLDPTTLTRARIVLSYAANLCAIIGTVLLARAWTVAGLDLPGTPWARRACVAVALAIALVLAGPSAYLNLTDALVGDGKAVVSLASDLGDILSTTLLAPTFLTAIAVRGGLLRWPWGLLTSSLFAWLLYDTFSTVLAEVPGHGPTFALGGEVLRVLACTLHCAAGLAQRAIVRVPRVR